MDPRRWLSSLDPRAALDGLNTPRTAWFLGTFLAGLVADQATKVWISINVVYGQGEIDIVPGWFSFVHARNTGAAFSTMEGERVLFLVFGVVASIVIVDLARRLERSAVAVPAILGLILAGVAGNGMDRARLGYVVDFLKVYAGEDPLRSWFEDRFGTAVWPIFNIADSLLVVGVIVFLAYHLLQREGKVPEVELGEDADSART